MHADLLTLINASTAVTEIAAGLIRWQYQPQAPADGKPFAVLTRTSGLVGFAHDGLSALDTARVQVDCFAPTFAQADALRTAITQASCGQQGVTGATDFRAIIPNAPRDFPKTNGLHRCLADITVTYRPAPEPEPAE
jgi:hypothetical protein